MEAGKEEKGTAAEATAAAPRTPSKRPFPNMPCSGCGREDVDWDDRLEGWAATSGDYFCKVCWNLWIALPAASAAAWTNPVPPPVPEGVAVPPPPIPDGPGRMRTKQKTGDVQGIDLICRFGGGKRLLRSRGCECCAPDGWRGQSALVGPWSFTSTVPDESEKWTCLYQSWGWRAKVRPLEKIRGLAYADAHCHLDIILQNVKYGGPGWDSKQKICKYWLDSMCPFAEHCDFAHGEEERNPRIPLVDKDVEPFMHDAVEASCASIATLTGQEPVRLRCIITSLCELESLQDTRVLLAAASRIFPPGTSTIYCSFGCHPHNYREYTDEFETTLLAEIEAAGSAAVAWGECGLDYCKNFDESLRPDERRRMVGIFERQARLASARKLPLVVHSREAEEDTMHVFRTCLSPDHPIHIHAFQGSEAMMKECLAEFTNCYFGVSGMLMLAFPVEMVVAVATNCPLDRLLLETDSPYLANGPYDVPRLGMRIAEMRGLPPAEVLDTTTANCLRLYGIGQEASNTVNA